jgi:hypothetical protein
MQAGKTEYKKPLVFYIIGSVKLLKIYLTKLQIGHDIFSSKNVIELNDNVVNLIFTVHIESGRRGGIFSLAWYVNKTS